MNELLVYLYNTCCISEVSIIPWILNFEEGYKIRTVAETKDPITSLEGWVLIPELIPKEIESSTKYEGLIFPGGVEITVSPLLKEIIHDFDKHERLLGAICAGPTHLALAGILNNYKYTTSLTPEYYKENDKPDPFPRNNFIQERCVCDKHIITADGIALVDFADAIVNYLGIFDARKYSRKDFRKDFTPVWK